MTVIDRRPHLDQMWGGVGSPLTILVLIWEGYVGYPHLVGHSVNNKTQMRGLLEEAIFSGRKKSTMHLTLIRVTLKSDFSDSAIKERK